MHRRPGRTPPQQPPSARVLELMRQGARKALDAPPHWLEELDEATLAPENMRVIAEDPVLAAAMRRTNRENLLHWAAANVRKPGAPVAANLSDEVLRVARDLVRRGVSEAALNSYRTGQNAAWMRWMTIAFELTSDPGELRELLEVSARSIAAFIDATILGISTQMNAERDELTRGTHAERRETVALLLDGAPLSARVAERRLGYRLDQVHGAAVVWSDESRLEPGALEGAVDVLARACGAQRPLTVVASAATLWVWLPGGGEPDLEQVRSALQRMPGVRIALGSTGRGVEGFRRGHLDALDTQRMLARLGAKPRLVTFDQVRLVFLVTQNAEGADQFVQHTLGALETAPVELRDTLLTFLDEGCNAARTAVRLHTHRNTLLRRLTRAEELLPRPLAHNRVHVAVALEVLRWRERGT